MNALNHDQLLEQIHQLPDEEYRKLVATLSSEHGIAKGDSKKDLRQLLLEAPTWSDQQLDEYQKARDFINQSSLG